MSKQKRPVVTILAAPETSASVLYGLYDILVSVGAVYLDMVTGIPGDELLDVRIVSAEGKPFHCIGNIPVAPHASIDEVDIADAVVICDMYASIYNVPNGRYPREVSWLKRMHRNGALLASVCSGTLLLAESGLLNGHHATSHWAYRDMFQRHFPAIVFRNESILCLEAESDRIVTAGGVSSWHDLSIYLIAQFCGYKAAIETAKVFLIDGHSEGQSPYSVMTRPMESNDGSISRCLTWVTDNYTIDKPVEKMVERSGLKSRTFSRRFRAATGVSPIEYVQALRVEQAKQLLEQEKTSNDEIGVEIGYDDPVSFRRVFKRYCGLSPAAYRKKFQRISNIASPLRAG
jgi:transcriptional regulator GlxA family with amidase domain